MVTVPLFCGFSPNKLLTNCVDSCAYTRLSKLFKNLDRFVFFASAAASLASCKRFASIAALRVLSVFSIVWT
jgi:hypothetical protein